MRHDRLCTASIFDPVCVFERRRLTCTGVEIALAVGAVAAATSTGLAINSAINAPDDPSSNMPPLPPNATDAEKAARDAANAAKQKQVGLASSGEGRGSTILTGGRLGEVGQPNLQPKTLLGL